MTFYVHEYRGIGSETHFFYMLFFFDSSSNYIQLITTTPQFLNTTITAFILDNSFENKIYAF